MRVLSVILLGASGLLGFAVLVAALVRKGDDVKGAGPGGEHRVEAPAVAGESSRSAVEPGKRARADAGGPDGAADAGDSRAAGPSGDDAGAEPRKAAAPPEPASKPADDPRPAVAEAIPGAILTALRGGDPRALAGLDVWLDTDPSVRMRLAVAALLVLEAPVVAIDRILALASALGEDDLDAPGRLGAALDAVLSGSATLPFSGLDSDRRALALEALLAADAHSDSRAAGMLLAWALPAAGRSSESAIDALVSLSSSHADPEVRALAVQNLGKIATVQTIIDEVGIVIELSPRSEDDLHLQQAYLIALLRARSAAATGAEDPTAELLVPQLEVALDGWASTPAGMQSVVQLMHYLTVQPMPALRPQLERVREQSPSPVLRSLAEQTLKRMPVPKSVPQDGSSDTGESGEAWDDGGNEPEDDGGGR